VQMARQGKTMGEWRWYFGWMAKGWEKIRCWGESGQGDAEFRWSLWKTILFWGDVKRPHVMVKSGAAQRANRHTGVGA
jgi:hypothetical protein